MVVKMRLLLMVSLAMLQLLMPFTHAHARENSIGSGGLHIAGLEMYGIEEKNNCPLLLGAVRSLVIVW